MTQTGRKALMGVAMTPMIDVVFNLLIFFVVITTASYLEGFLAAQLPSESAAQGGLEIPALPIMIIIHSGQSFEDCQVELSGLGRNPDSFSELGDLLRGMHVDGGGLYNADNPVVLSLGAGVSVDQMVKTYNAVAMAGFKNIQFVRSH